MGRSNGAVAQIKNTFPIGTKQRVWYKTLKLKRTPFIRNDADKRNEIDEEAFSIWVTQDNNISEPFTGVEPVTFQVHDGRSKGWFSMAGKQEQDAQTRVRCNG